MPMTPETAERALAICERLENAYQFECEAGPLKNCTEWQELRRLIADAGDKRT